MNDNLIAILYLMAIFIGCNVGLIIGLILKRRDKCY